MQATTRSEQIAAALSALAAVKLVKVVTCSAAATAERGSGANGLLLKARVEAAATFHYAGGRAQTAASTELCTHATLQVHVCAITDEPRVAVLKIAQKTRVSKRNTLASHAFKMAATATGRPTANHAATRRFAADFFNGQQAAVLNGS